MPLSDFARRHLDGALNHDGAAKEIADAIDSGGGGGVTLPVTVAQDAFNNTQLIGTDMPDLVGDLDGFTGYDNIAIGLESYNNFGAGLPYTPDPTHYALAAVTTGTGNVALGPSCLMALTTGNYNVAIGNFAGSGLTTGRSNILIGLSVGGVSGSYNVAIGESALAAATTAGSNVAIGKSAGAGLTTASHNVLIGTSSGGPTMTGDSNTLVGESSGAALTSGTLNLCIGHNAGGTITTGSSNVCIGRDSGVGSVHLTTGNDNTLIGKSAATAAVDISGAVAIGSGTVTAAGQCVIGNEAAGTYPLALGFGGATAPADGDIANGQAFLYWDFSASGVVLKFKGKAADGTVISKTVSTV